MGISTGCTLAAGVILRGLELSHTQPGPTSTGVVKTSLVTDLTWSQKMLVYLPNIGQMLTPEQGTYNLLWAITTKKENIKNGGIYMLVDKLSNDKTESSEDPKLKKKLREWTETELKQYL
jgi:hypothetical protein